MPALVASLVRIPPMPFAQQRAFYALTLAIAVLVYFQQVLVINIGGSFKLCELAALAMLGVFLWFPRKLINGRLSALLFLFFCVWSALGYLYFFIDPVAGEYYGRFGEARDVLRFNQFVSPILIYLYCAFTWCFINAVAGNELLFHNRERLYRYFLITGTLVSLYALYGMIFVGGAGLPDLVPDFLDSRNSRPEDYALRTIGFSSEPGQFLPLASWAFLYSLYLKDLFSRRTRLLLIGINGVSMVMTFSSSIVALGAAWLGFYVIFGSLRQRVKALVTGVALVGGIIGLAAASGLLGLLEYFFVTKLTEFVDPSTTGGVGSGAQRAYTTLLGLEVFKAYPVFGVGAGNSYYYLHQFETAVGLYVDMLTFSTAPQNAHVMMLAETGLLGYGTFLLFFALLIIRAIREYRQTQSDEIKVHLIGAVATFGYLFAIYPIYSLYLWFNIAVLMNLLRFAPAMRRISATASPAPAGTALAAA